MRAVTIVDGGLRVEEHPDPEPGAGEVLVRVFAAGINGADLLQAGGGYPAPEGSPQDIPGLELAGEVVGTGPGPSHFRAGDRVMAVVGGGGQAELAVVHERHLLRVPDGVGWLAAGGFPETFTTAHDALVTQAALRMGDSLLVNGAAGGVGIAAVQVGHLAGAVVTASVRSGRLRAEVEGLGATRAVAPDEVAAHGPYDVVLELVGAPNMAANLEALAMRGRIVVIGVSAGNRAEINLHQLMTRRGRVMASTLRSRSLEDKALCARAVEAQLLPHLAAGRLVVPVAAHYALDDVQAAYDRFAAGDKLGKVVIAVAPTP